MTSLTQVTPSGQQSDRSIAVRHDGEVYRWYITLSTVKRYCSNARFETWLEAMEAAASVAGSYDATLEIPPALAQQLDDLILAEVRRMLPGAPEDIIQGTAAVMMGEHYADPETDWAAIEDEQIGD